MPDLLFKSTRITFWTCTDTRRFEFLEKQLVGIPMHNDDGNSQKELGIKYLLRITETALENTMHVVMEKDDGGHERFVTTITLLLVQSIGGNLSVTI